MTEAAFYGRLRSMLRKSSQWWVPIKQTLINARRPNQSDNKRLKWEFKCAQCQQWFRADEVQVDHTIPCGPLTSLEHLPRFVANLFDENLSHYQVLCKADHQEKTNAEAAARRAEKEEIEQTA